MITLAKLLRHHLQSQHVAVDTDLNYNFSMLCSAKGCHKNDAFWNALAYSLVRTEDLTAVGSGGVVRLLPGLVHGFPALPEDHEDGRIAEDLDSVL